MAGSAKRIGIPAVVELAQLQVAQLHSASVAAKAPPQRGHIEIGA
jgi:hypothetical protein